MRKHPFLIFAAVIGSMIAAMIWFIQSPRFARVVKGVIARYVPKDMGIEGDFSDLSVRLFPPGIAVNKPRLTVRVHNVLDLPPGSRVEVDRINLSFRPFQMFSGDIRVKEVTVVGGFVHLALNPEGAKPAPKKGARREFHWDELLHIHAEAVALENTRLELELERERSGLEIEVSSLRVGQWSGSGGLGYEVALDVRKAALTGSTPPDWAAALVRAGLPLSLEGLRGGARVNALGLELESLELAIAGLNLHVDGEVHGNLLAPRGLSVELKAAAEGELAEILVLARKGANPVGDGKVRFNGQITANLDRPWETLKIDGKVEGERVRYLDWSADEVRIEGGWRSGGAAGGELVINRGLIAQKETPRMPPRKPGAGGRVEIGAFKLPLDGKHAAVVPLTLAGAHIQWLGAPALKKIFPLMFRASGPVQATFTPPAGNAKWKLGAHLKLAVTDFQLDNQHLEVSKPLRKILSVPRIEVAGDVGVDGSGITVEGVELGLPETKFHASGKVDFKTGFDLRVGGKLNLKDIGTIAENPIRGEGVMDVHVHGPFERVFVDFDPDVKGAMYLNLDLGELKGRVTWDDDADHLLFTRMNARKGATRYVGDGMIAVGTDSSIALGFEVPQGDIHDFIGIFDHMVNDLWWFPHSLTGALTGSIKVSGGLSLKELVVAAKISGTGWEYLGERAQAVSLAGGYDRGKYHVADFKAIKRLGVVSGRIAVDADRRFDWDVRTNDLTLSDLDHIASLDVPIRGRITAVSTGKGKEGALQSATDITLTELAVRGAAMPASQLNVRSENGVAVVKGTALGGSGVLDLSYDFTPGGKSALRAEARRLDFSPILLLVNPKAIYDRAIAGYVSGAVNLAFGSGEAERATGSFQLSEYLLAKTGSRFTLVEPADVRVQDGTFNLQGAVLRGNQGEAVLTLKGTPTGIEGGVSGEIDVSVVEFATPSIVRAEGTATLDFDLGGTLKEPTILGKASLNSATVQVASLESPFENITGSFAFKQNVITVQNLEADLAGGRTHADGTVTLFASRYPSIDLKSSLSGNKLQIFPFQYIHLKGAVGIKGEEPPYLVSGNVVIDSALSKVPVLSQRQTEGLKAIQYTPPPSSRMRSSIPFFRLNIGARADRGVLVQNDLFDAEMRGNLTLVNTLEAPRLLGSAELVAGRMLFKDRVFQIQSFTTNFDNPTVLEPSFALIANTEVNQVKIQLYATGRPREMKIELTSNPSMPESEIVSLLALGLTANDSRRLGSSDRAVVEQGEAASLLLHSLDFNREVHNKTGLDIQLDESVNTQVGSSISKPQGSGESSAAPRIVIRRKIGKKVDLTYRSTVGVGTRSEREVNAEVHVTPGLSVIGVWDYNETVDPLKNTNNSYGSYGLDLKVQRGFK